MNNKVYKPPEIKGQRKHTEEETSRANACLVHKHESAVIQIEVLSIRPPKVLSHLESIPEVSSKTFLLESSSYMSAANNIKGQALMN